MVASTARGRVYRKTILYGLHWRPENNDKMNADRICSQVKHQNTKVGSIFSNQISCSWYIELVGHFFATKVGGLDINDNGRNIL